jgi:hypothetical protein
MEGLGAGARRSGNDGGSVGVPSLLSSLNAQWRVILAQDSSSPVPDPATRAASSCHAPADKGVLPMPRVLS